MKTHSAVEVELDGHLLHTAAGILVGNRRRSRKRNEALTPTAPRVTLPPTVPSVQ